MLLNFMKRNWILLLIFVILLIALIGLVIIYPLIPPPKCLPVTPSFSGGGWMNMRRVGIAMRLPCPYRI